ncbi:nucleotidyltransferase family protein [Candidatus Woesearchaeota archaeon]|nr:nucleotidyltransferase family protein [Candidatus Woesearchaeota archaeon]
MKKLEELQKKLSQNKNMLREKYYVKSIGIFGSFARGEQKKGSDIDVLIEFNRPISFFKFIELENCLGELLGAKVDLVSKKALRPYIGGRILKEVVNV